MRIADRLLTIVVTATLTSAAWIVAGGSLVKLAEENNGASGDTVAAADAQGTPVPPARSPHTRGIAGGERPGDRELLIPVEGIAASALTDTFTDARGEGTRLHEAIDIMAPAGTPVVAAAAGTIERLFVSDAGGNTIYVRSACPPVSLRCPRSSRRTWPLPSMPAAMRCGSGSTRSLPPSAPRCVPSARDR
ncbi:M23 family metallopeptidase [Leptolyngbya sp. 15MV]|nr:M23 family metallopeptidase [Leptolyngbya sp. 15MV]